MAEAPLTAETQRQEREPPPTAVRCGCSLHAAANTGLSGPA